MLFRSCFNPLSALTGATLDMVFLRASGPAELLDGFAAVREAFRISKPLAGLLG